VNAKSVAADNDSRAYHHGDLPQTLMDAAIRRIAADGTENLSLRALARECGVSPTAPYRHFPSKRCLFAAIATRGFQELQSHCEQACADSGTPDAGLLAACQAYINFALDNPTVYHLMFGSVLEDFSEYQMLADAAESAYQVVLDLLEAIRASRPGLDLEATQLGAVVWSAIHGIASLLLFALARKSDGGPASPQASMVWLQANTDRTLNLLLRGLIEPELPQHSGS